MFGMGTGVTSSVWPRESVIRAFQSNRVTNKTQRINNQGVQVYWSSRTVD